MVQLGGWIPFHFFCWQSFVCLSGRLVGNRNNGQQVIIYMRILIFNALLGNIAAVVVVVVQGWNLFKPLSWFPSTHLDGSKQASELPIQASHLLPLSHHKLLAVIQCRLESGLWLWLLIAVFVEAAAAAAAAQSAKRCIPCQRADIGLDEDQIIWDAEAEMPPIVHELRVCV